MCEPTTLALVGMGLAVGGGVQKGVAAKSAADANADTMDSNAVLADYAAQDAVQRGEQGAGRARMRGGQTIASQRAEYGASGVDVRSGSAIDVGASTGAVSELDAQIIKANATREAFGYSTQAKGMRRQARYSRQAGDAALTSSILGGVAQAVPYGRGLSIGGGGGGASPYDVPGMLGPT